MKHIKVTGCHDCDKAVEENNCCSLTGNDIYYELHDNLVIPDHCKLDDYKEQDEYRALTVQALRMANEVYLGAGMDKDVFIDTYLNGIGDYERQVAKEEGIEID